MSELNQHSEPYTFTVGGELVCRYEDYLRLEEQKEALRVALADVSSGVTEQREDISDITEAFREVLGYLHAYRSGADAAPELGWAIRNFNEVCERHALLEDSNLRLEEQLEALRVALADARDLAVAVADKNIGPLSERAREVQGAANDALGDLPMADEVAGILAVPSPAKEHQ